MYQSTGTYQSLVRIQATLVRTSTLVLCAKMEESGSGSERRVRGTLLNFFSPDTSVDQPIDEFDDDIIGATSIPGQASSPVRTRQALLLQHPELTNSPSRVIILKPLLLRKKSTG